MHIIRVVAFGPKRALKGWCAKHKLYKPIRKLPTPITALSICTCLYMSGVSFHRQNNQVARRPSEFAVHDDKEDGLSASKVPLSMPPITLHLAMPILGRTMPLNMTMTKLHLTMPTH